MFNYIYAVLHSPEYRRRYADFLKSDFPRVPLTSNRALFTALVGLGQRLASLHLMEADGADQPAFPIAGNNQVSKLRYAPPASSAPGRVFINSGQYFEGVTPETWAFTIGGYRPAEKWLKDRKGESPGIRRYHSLPPRMRRACRNAPDHVSHRPANRILRRMAPGLVLRVGNSAA